MIGLYHPLNRLAKMTTMISLPCLRPRPHPCCLSSPLQLQKPQALGNGSFGPRSQMISITSTRVCYSQSAKCRATWTFKMVTGLVTIARTSVCFSLPWSPNTTSATSNGGSHSPRHLDFLRISKSLLHGCILPRSQGRASRDESGQTPLKSLTTLILVTLPSSNAHCLPVHPQMHRDLYLTLCNRPLLRFTLVALPSSNTHCLLVHPRIHQDPCLTLCNWLLLRFRMLSGGVCRIQTCNTMEVFGALWNQARACSIGELFDRQSQMFRRKMPSPIAEGSS